jgi:hypothetical protein
VTGFDDTKNALAVPDAAMTLIVAAQERYTQETGKICAHQHPQPESPYPYTPRG